MNLKEKAKTVLPSHSVQCVNGALTLLKCYKGLNGSVPVQFKGDCAFVYGVVDGLDAVVRVDTVQENLYGQFWNDLFEQFWDVSEKRIVWIEDGTLIRVDRDLTIHFSEKIIVEIMEDFINFYDMEVGKIEETEVSIRIDTRT